MGKEYGKLTADQFKGFVGKLPGLREQHQEMSRLLRELPRESFGALMEENFNWAGVYELTFAQHIAYCVIAFGQVPYLQEIGKAADSWDRELRDEDVSAEFSKGQLILGSPTRFSGPS